jgi:uncharacterized protein (UPF0335 family)
MESELQAIIERLERVRVYADILSDYIDGTHTQATSDDSSLLKQVVRTDTEKEQLMIYEISDSTVEIIDKLNDLIKTQ